MFIKKTYSILSTYYIYSKEYTKAIENAKQAISLLKQKPFDTKIAAFTFLVDQIIVFLITKKHERAQFLIRETKLLFKNKTINYFRVRQFEFSNLVLWKKYEALYEVVTDVMGSSRLPHYTYHLEMWKIREAYVRFLIEAGEIKLGAEEMQSLKPYRMGKLMNEVPIYSREKRGTNISILVLQMLFFIARKKYGHVIDRIDALKQYSFKYLRNDDTFRSNCFIKMLIKIPEANFHAERVRLHTRDLEQKLAGHELDIYDITADVEIIPFHDLWQIILRVLAKNWAS